MSFSIPQYLVYAQYAQLAYAEREAKELFFKGSFSSPRYSHVLSVTRQAIQERYDREPSDPTLQATGEFMYALSGGVNAIPDNITTTFIIIIQPLSQVINSGDNVSFLVAVAGGTSPYSYQWYFNNTLIVGATNAIYNITGATSGNAGNYKCVITDANGQTLTSQNATLTVNIAQLIANWWFGDTDPWPDISTGTDNLTYLGSVNFNPGGPIVISWPSASANNKYRVVRYPVTEGDIVSWVNIVGFNYGPVPGTAYNPIATITTKKYVVSKGDSVQSPYSVIYSE